MGVDIRLLAETDYNYSDVFVLIQDSYKERIEQGIEFNCSKYSLDEFISKFSEKSYTLVAIDTQSDNLLGTVTWNLMQKGKKKYGYTCFFAVSSKSKNQGIGSALLHEESEMAKDQGCQYLLSDTARDACSSIRTHQKEGYNIVGLYSFTGTSYYSVIMRKELNNDVCVWHSKLFLKLSYLVSCFLVKMLKKEDGTKTSLGALLLKIKTAVLNNNKKN